VSKKARLFSAVNCSISGEPVLQRSLWSAFGMTARNESMVSG
jgi:hypothetical protein